MFNYYSLDRQNLFELAKFVVEENYSHHRMNNRLLDKEVDEIYLEELRLDNSKIFVSTDQYHSIVGSIRVSKWNGREILPMQKLFNINIDGIGQDNKYNVWHIGRFAIKKGIDKTGFNVFKILMVCAINEVCQNEDCFALAECDAKLLRVLKLLGIEAITLADSINYLGSETIPVLLTYTGLKKFLDKNRHLIPQNINPTPVWTSLHQSVVF